MSEAGRSLLRISVCTLAFSLMTACAGPPPRAASTQPTQPSGVDAPQADVDTAMRKRGYQPATFRGQRVYCRSEPLTGSNLQSRVCRTAKEIEDQERAGKDVLNGNHPAGCLPRSGCN
jgi:hypothetical protein